VQLETLSHGQIDTLAAALQLPSPSGALTASLPAQVINTNLRLTTGDESAVVAFQVRESLKPPVASTSKTVKVQKHQS
jgi:hypothetical protein